MNNDEYKQTSYHHQLKIKIPFNGIDGDRFRLDESGNQKSMITSIQSTVHDVAKVHVGPEYNLRFPVNSQTWQTNILLLQTISIKSISKGSAFTCRRKYRLSGAVHHRRGQRRRPTPQTRTLACSHTAIRNPLSQVCRLMVSTMSLTLNWETVCRKYPKILKKYRKSKKNIVA